MLLTLVVALLSAGARRLENVHAAPDHQVMVIWSLSLTVVGFLALWSELAFGPRSNRSLFLFALSLTLGALVAFLGDAPFFGWVYVIATALIHPLILLGSLRVVRSCGYRLGRGSVADSARASESELANEGTRG
jgi:hypothetical protein